MQRVERYSGYKDSGVDWLGVIPEGWEIKKLKYIKD
jgi:type I restriction enzyme S subunit